MSQRIRLSIPVRSANEILKIENRLVVYGLQYLKAFQTEMNIYYLIFGESNLVESNQKNTFNATPTLSILFVQ
jgi:hypothetical protein